MNKQSGFTRNNVEINAEGTMLRGWIYLPQREDNKPIPAIVMAHGYAGLKEMFLKPYAEKFAANGFAVLLFDHRNFGDSDGTPRHEIDPWQQVEDYRHVITYASSLPEVDSYEIGVWGTSYSGGHVLVVGATDKRVKCVVSQVPTISGSKIALRRVNGDALTELLDSFADDRLNRQRGGDPVYYSVVPGGEYENSVYKSKDAIEFYTKGSEKFINKVTLRSIELSRGYEPGAFIANISPTPLLMLVAKNDFITPTDLALAAYEQALEPKKLVLIPGGHFDPYSQYFDQSSSAAVEWFKTHLLDWE
ncbi:alpha/beta hydrolase [Bacillus sp. sid0103]|uniref:alpha/beta hydrolase n=1 Tax=Bacillus sp. sid0103 TaxID=2856337 RepID=UPI001C49558C|nr:alpha/beta hydrolase [Bacillus sp. sid0103]MBV7509656.1 alpha/beta hydrolase [Bacillus sp. sid0103]